MQRGLINNKNGVWSYVRFGSGEKLLIALHGHAERGDIFEILEPALAADYTVYALDFPYHGKTTWQKPFFNQEDILEVIESIKKETGKKTFTAMGYSFGARVWQVLFPKIEKNLISLIFIAPDGFRSQGMRTLALVPDWVRCFLHKKLQNPAKSIKIVQKLRRWRLISQFRADYYLMNIANERRIERAFGMWKSVDFFQQNLKTFQQNLNRTQIPITIYLGNRDKIIHEKPILKMAQNIPSMQVFFVEGGHRLVGEVLCKVMMEKRKNR